MNLRRLPDAIRAALAEDIRITCARSDAARLHAWRRVGVLLLVLVLAACTPKVQTVTRELPPMPVVCPAECLQPCQQAGEFVWAPPDPDSGAAWPLLVRGPLAGLVEALERCDAQRAACVRCIETAERSGRICGNVEAC